MSAATGDTGSRHINYGSREIHRPYSTPIILEDGELGNQQIKKAMDAPVPLYIGQQEPKKKWYEFWK